MKNIYLLTKKMKEKTKFCLSIASFIAAIVIGFIALFIPPVGIIDTSVLWFVAQLLVFTSGILGINMNIDFLNKKTETKQN